MNGFLLIDKPKGITSFFCIKKLRWLLNIKKMGFAGTLDPLATGLMIVAVGEATKMIPFLEGTDKVYEVKIKLGEVSTTYDAEGEISKYKGAEKPERSRIIEVLNDEFLGEREQVPPIYSAIWVDGKRAYDLARKKVDFKLKSRNVVFYELQLKSYVWPYLTLMIHCSSGTYVRSLAYDLGEALKCGGHVVELRRLKVGSFSVKNGVLLDDLNELNVKASIIAPEQMFSSFLQIELTEDQYAVLENGGFIKNVGNNKDVPILAMYKGVCVGILELFKGEIKFKKKFQVFKNSS